MNVRRFRTDKRLWLYLALGLFVAIWFCPWAWVSPKVDSAPPAILWALLFVGLFPAEDQLIRVGPVFVVLCFYGVLFGIAALVVGWVLQCFVVIVRQTWRDRHGHAA